MRSCDSTTTIGPALLALLLACPATALAQDARPAPRLALALSGGGARGIAHIGALRALEEAGIPVDAVAANSMGAVVGGLYATGRSAREIENTVRSLDWASLFSGRPDRRTLPISRRRDRYAPLAGVSLGWSHVRLPPGLVAEHRVNRFLIQNLAPAAYAAGGDFDRLAVRFRAVATDLADGEPVVLAQGDLARAVRASMSIPLVFAPVDWHGRRLVDGLVVDNLPMDVAKAWKPAVLVAVDISSPELEPSDYETALGVATRVNDLLTKRRNRDFEAEADVVVRPDLGRHSATDYSGFDELIRQGYEATRAAIPQIREKLAAAGVVDLPQRPQASPGAALEGTAIREVAVRGNLRLEDRQLLRTFNVPTGPGYDMERGLRAFDKIGASGLVDRTWMEFEPVPGGVRVVLLVKEAPPNRADVALGFSEWERTRAAVRLRNQNSLGFGQELELLLAASDAESLASLGLTNERALLGALGYAVRAYANTDKPRFFDPQGYEVNRATFERTGVELALRAPLKRWLEVEAGLRVGGVRTRAEAGIELPEAHDEVRTLFANASYDTLDSVAWAEHGERLSVLAEWSPSELGPSYDYWRVSVRGTLGRPLGRRAALQLDSLASLSGGSLPVYDWQRVGGVELVPGYHHEQLKGAQALALGASLRCRVLGELRAVARGGAGNVFDHTSDISLAGIRWGVGLGVMMPTRVGPISAEIGVRDGGSTLVSVALGWD
jgi:NTE family protein